VPVRFGFSDRVRVYLNGRMLYAGNDGFGAHDPDSLGIVGLFDELALPLERGPNELWFVVSETFGGWAITADLPDRDGITVNARSYLKSQTGSVNKYRQRERATASEPRERPAFAP